MQCYVKCIVESCTSDGAQVDEGEALKGFLIPNSVQFELNSKITNGKLLIKTKQLCGGGRLLGIPERIITKNVRKRQLSNKKLPN